MAGSARGSMKHGRAQAAERKELAKNDISVEHLGYAQAMGIKAKAKMSLAESVAHHVHEHENEYHAFMASSADRKAARQWRDHMRQEHAQAPTVAKTRPPRRMTPRKTASDEYVPF